MTSVIELPNRARLIEEAAAWIARLDSGRLSAEELPRLRAWIERSPEHLEELEGMAERWDRLDMLAMCRDLLAEPRARRRPGWLPIAMAAGLATLAIAVWSLLDTPLEQTPRQQLIVASVHITAIGEQKTIPLPDGSSINLNTGSQLEVNYSTALRHFRLDRGEAYFEVAAASGRPFVVETSRGVVTATGTAFAVRVRPESIEVTVQKGQVEVGGAQDVSLEPPDQASESTAVLATLSAGQSAIFDDALESVQTLEPSRMVRRLAWRDGMLIFDGDSLATVIAEVTRYNDVEIVISDPALRDRRIGGYFRTGEAEALLTTLESDFGVRVEHIDDKLIYLHPAGR